MTPDILILRPQPGAEETLERAAALGLSAAVAPIFAVSSVEWESPDPGRFHAVLVTSAHAPRQAGPGVARFLRLPCYAVGEATAAAARDAGFADIRTGPGDGAALAAMAAEDGARRALHLCGRDHVPLQAAGMEIERRIVYASQAAVALPVPAIAAIEADALVLLHSPRAAALFAALVDVAGLDRGSIALAAISAAAAAAAGEGWKSVAAPERPRDAALLALAVRLCKSRDERYGKGG